MTTEENLEELGQIFDMIENMEAATLMPLPPQMHIDCLKDGMDEIKGRIKQVYFELGGTDVWSV